MIRIAVQASVDFAVDNSIGQFFGCKGKINGQFSILLLVGWSFWRCKELQLECFDNCNKMYCFSFITGIWMHC
jgi:hypothetical protein